jgi:hypothetical protein
VSDSFGAMMNDTRYQITQSDWREWEEQCLVRLLSNSDFRYGASFVNWFHEAADYMAEYSNLGTPAGVHHPNDDDILYNIRNNDEALSFIRERIEIVEDHVNG